MKTKRNRLPSKHHFVPLPLLFHPPYARAVAVVTTAATAATAITTAAVTTAFTYGVGGVNALRDAAANAGFIENSGCGGRI